MNNFLNYPVNNNFKNFRCETRECKECDENGKIACKECDGSGILKAGVQNTVSQLTIDKYIIKHNKEPNCRTCGGSGKLRHGACHGSGIQKLKYYTFC
jgi:hypothetical protein